MGRFCTRCGTPLTDGARFCRICGAAAGGGAAPPQQNNPSFSRYMKELAVSMKAILKNPKALIKSILPALIVSVIWIALSLLESFGISNPLVRILNTLTYAQGGMFGGFFGAVGGILGKALFSYVLCALVSAAVNKRKINIKALFSGFSVTGAQAAGFLLSGAGFAMLLYTLFNITSSFENAMIAVSGIACVTMVSGAGGGMLLYGITGLAKLLTGGKSPSTISISRFLSGMAAGFALAIPLSIPSVIWLIPVVCGVILTAGILLCIFGESLRRRGAAAAALVLIFAMIPCFSLLSLPVLAAAEQTYLSNPFDENAIVKITQSAHSGPSTADGAYDGSGDAPPEPSYEPSDPGYDDTDPGYYDETDPDYYDETDPDYYDETDPDYYDDTDPGYYDETDPDYYDDTDPGYYDTEPDYYDDTDPDYYDTVPAYEDTDPEYENTEPPENYDNYYDYGDQYNYEDPQLENYENYGETEQTGSFEERLDTEGTAAVAVVSLLGASAGGVAGAAAGALGGAIGGAAGGAVGGAVGGAAGGAAAGTAGAAAVSAPGAAAGLDFGGGYSMPDTGGGGPGDYESLESRMLQAAESAGENASEDQLMSRITEANPYIRLNADGTATWTDPVTGRQATYARDADGTYDGRTLRDMNEETLHIVRNKEYYSQIAETAERYARESAEDFKHFGERAMEEQRLYNQKLKQDAEKLEMDSRLERLSIKHGMGPNATHSQVRAKLNRITRLASEDAKEQNAKADMWEKAEGYAEKTVLVADTFLDVAENIAPGGKSVNAIYKVLKGAGQQAAADANADSASIFSYEGVKNMAKGAAEGLVSGGVDAGTGFINHKGWKAAGTVAGETGKKVLRAYRSGGDMGEAATEGIQNGLFNATVDFSADFCSEKGTEVLSDIHSRSPTFRKLGSGLAQVVDKFSPGAENIGENLIKGGAAGASDLYKYKGSKEIDRLRKS